MSESSLGKAGYEAYAKSTGGKTFDNRPMPAWSELPERIQRAWADAAKAIAHHVYEAVKAAEACPETERAPDGYPDASKGARDD